MIDPNPALGPDQLLNLTSFEIVDSRTNSQLQTDSDSRVFELSNESCSDISQIAPTQGLREIRELDSSLSISSDNESTESVYFTPLQKPAEKQASPPSAKRLCNSEAQSFSELLTQPNPFTTVGGFLPHAGHFYARQSYNRPSSCVASVHELRRNLEAVQRAQKRDPYANTYALGAKLSNRAFSNFFGKRVDHELCQRLAGARELEAMFRRPPEFVYRPPADTQTRVEKLVQEERSLRQELALQNKALRVINQVEGRVHVAIKRWEFVNKKSLE